MKGNEVSKAWEWECQSQVESVYKFPSKQDVDNKMAIYNLGRYPIRERDHESNHKNLHVWTRLSNKMWSDKKPRDWGKSQAITSPIRDISNVWKPALYSNGDTLYAYR